MIPFNTQWDRIEKELLEAQRRAISQAASQVYKETVDRTPLGRPELWKNSTVPDNYAPGALRKAWEINWGGGFINAAASFTGKLNSVSGASGYELGKDIAPHGMMRLSVKKYKSFLEQAVARNKV